MALLNQLFGGKAPAPIELDLVLLKAHIAEAAAKLASQDIFSDLLLARLADRYRDLRMDPVLSPELKLLINSKDVEVRRRCALTVGLLELQEVGTALPLLIAKNPAAFQPGLAKLIQTTQLLSMELLRLSPHRVEEFSRNFIMCVGALVKGEAEGDSKQFLAQLDYGSLLQAAERAKVSAEGRMDYIKKLQDQRDMRKPRM